ncbi:MAG: ABC transporter permease [Lachnospiraceae bacterium]|nr:ABC transporter permease [Lachnospiraceae bacterium]
MKEKTPFFERPTVLSVISSLLCILAGLLIGFLVLLLINPAGAGDAVTSMLKNFMNYPSHPAQMKYLGQTLVKTAPLLMCALSIQFCYKVGLFNIGAAGQYVVGVGASLFGALRLQLPWFLCLLLAMFAGALWGAIVGFLKAFRNVNEVISGIMLNWISLYLVNALLTPVKELASNYTEKLGKINKGAVLPSLGLGKLFSNDPYVTIAIPLALLIAVALWIIMNKTVFGYELRATGLNKDAAKYAGMKEKKNIIITLVIGGMLAALGGAFFFLTDLPQWSVTQSSVPGMGFSGIAATFLGALHPIGTIFSSFFIQHITDGGAHINMNVYPSQISDLISAIIIYLCAFVLFFKFFISRRAALRREREHTHTPPPPQNEAKGGEAA